MKKESPLLKHARLLAVRGRFAQLLTVSLKLQESYLSNGHVDGLLDLGTLLLSAGFLSEAKHCFDKALLLNPTATAVPINLANVLREQGEPTASRHLYAKLLVHSPNHPVIRRNALIGLEYDAEVLDAERFSQACSWGQWAITRAGGVRPRPAVTPATNRALRIGYVSADLCQHTVGLFVKEVLKAHDPSRVAVFAYSAGQISDWVTDEIRAACTFREVAALDDLALEALIRSDGIDVLIDLSGHTAGSRLTAFAYRPAPVMVSWLGYFATTGLPYLDAVLLDDWHAPPGTESQFTEPIIRLPSGRFCYQPVPWAPVTVAPSPCIRNGYITFGCFNNTAKLNDGVLNVWARVLQAVPNARLSLKWRTFNDEALRQRVTQKFQSLGIDPMRIALRGPSFHADLLNEYAEIDIALDPFPFTGGLTSCEALWMGVPVVTWPQSRVVSRQTYALLNQLGLAELAANDQDDYVRIAAQLASDTQRLVELRKRLRDQMRTSPLMDVAGLTRELENTLRGLHDQLANQRDDAHDPRSRANTMKIITIDNQDYALDALSDDAKAQLAGLQLVDAELKRLHAQVAVLQTARHAYASALKASLQPKH